MAWVPILNIVLTVVFFAMFPVIFPLFLMPQTGVGSLKGYAMGFFYLAAWGPLYVILHMICMTRGQAAAAGVAGGGVTLGSYAGIGAVNGETATIAGFMLMSVPFLAAGLARGAMSIAGQSMSMLAPAQNAAEAAAVEQTTGNYAYGNVSWANATSNMRQSDQWTSAPSFLDGAPSIGWRQENGAVLSGFGNGQDVVDMNGAISRLDFQPQATSGTVAEWREMASAAHRQAQAYENAAQEILTATHSNRTAFGTATERASGWDTGSGSSASTAVEQFDRQTGSSAQGTEERSSTGQSVRVSNGHERSAGTVDQVTGRIEGIVGGGVGRVERAGGGAQRRHGLGNLLPNVAGSVSKVGSQQDSLRHSTDDMVQRWAQEKRDDLWKDIRGEIAEPDLVEIHRPDTSDGADVRAAYRPHSVGGIPKGPGGGDPGGAEHIIEAGRSALGDAQALAQAARATRVQGSADMQSEVAHDHDKGFFNDPRLRQ